MNKISILHPFVFAFYLILFLFSYNKEQMRLVDIIPSLIITFVATGTLFAVLYLFTKNKHKSALITSLALLFFFTYGLAYAPLELFKIGGVIVGRFRYFFPFWFLLFSAGAYSVFRVTKNLEFVTKAVMIASVVLALFPVTDLVLFAARRFYNANGSVVERATESGSGGYADIYYIILDQYAHAGTLKKFGYDNGLFIADLEKLGFFVREKSASNYSQTAPSLKSSLNMRYVENFNPQDKLYEEYKSIRDNKVLRILSSKGYKTFHLGGYVGITEYNQFADINISCGRVNELEALIIRTTPLQIIDRIFSILNGDQRNRILCQFKTLSEIPLINGQKFVFAHIISPHSPYVFGPIGETISPEKSVIEDKNSYLNQVRYLNTLVLDTVGKILERSKTTPIIILQSDHGASFVSEEIWNNPTDDFLNEQMRNFMAIYGPDLNKPRFASEVVTPVNLFPFIFNQYFGSDYPILENKVYFSSHSKPFIFIDVTNRLKFDQEDI